MKGRTKLTPTPNPSPQGGGGFGSAWKMPNRAPRCADKFPSPLWGGVRGGGIARAHLREKAS